MAHIQHLSGKIASDPELEPKSVEALLKGFIDALSEETEKAIQSNRKENEEDQQEAS